MLGWSQKQLLDATPRYFFNSVKGKYDYEEQRVQSERNLLFAGQRFNASMISAGLSSKLAKKIQDLKFEWEQERVSETEDSENGRFTYGDLLKWEEKLEQTDG